MSTGYSLALYELEYGWANAPDAKKPVVRQLIEDVQADFGLLTLSVESAKVFGTLKKIIKDSCSPSKEHMKKFNVDLMPAATALTSQCILISADRLYEDIRRYFPSFQIENWTV